MDFEAAAEGRQPEAEPLPVVAAPMDLETIRVDLKAVYDDQINKMVDVAEDHQVTDQASEVKAVEMAGSVKSWLKRLDEERRNIISEPDGFTRGVNGLCRTFKARLSEIEGGLKKKIGDFQWKKEIERRKRERLAREEQEKLQRKIAAEAKKAKVDPPPPPPPPPVEKKETVTRTESGASAHIRTEWKMTEIIDFAKVPDEYKALDAKQVNAAIKAGVRNIPGLTIKEIPITVLRA